MKLSEVVARQLLEGSEANKFIVREGEKLFVTFNSFRLQFVENGTVVTYYNDDVEVHVETYNVHPLNGDTLSLAFSGRLPVEFL